MSSQIREEPEVLTRMTVIPKAFYIRTEKSSWNPTGIIKMYRMTRAQDTFAYHSVRIKNPEELARVKLTLAWLAGELKWQELPEILGEFKKELKKDEKTISPQTLKLVQQYPEAANEILKGFDTLFRGHLRSRIFPQFETSLKQPQCY